MALTLGPLQYDVNLARKALAGMGTDEMLLTEVILGRPSHEIRLLKGAYRQRFGKDLVEAVKSDLSGAAERSMLSFIVRDDSKCVLRMLHSVCHGVECPETSQ